ncbi:MAG: M23 family metallopeptidase, partial [Chloroflexi bacterium]|nr:M23 family metallopeptidase [Chloroflexota bacterium]
YYVALDTEADAQFLLEANYKIGIQTASDTPDLAWPLPDVRAVDISAQGEDVYVLAREIDTWAGRALRYQNTVSMIYFKPPKIISQPRQIAAGETAVYILDQAGKRLLACDRETGALQTVYQLPQNDQISAFWIDETDQRLILAGRDRLFFYQEPERLTAVSASPLLIGAQSHDADFLAKPTGFVVPIGGSGVTRRDFQLPGAPRHYRLGIHNGIDFYWQPGTQTLAVADGVVIRAVLDYVSPTQAQFSAWRAETLQLGYTSEEALDVYRGRQVWLRHENGLVTRYVHLSGIAPEIVEGATVTQGQLVGTVGNSGSPLSLTSETADAHLHFEVWLNDYYVGQFLRPIEAREWVEMTFTGMTDGN